MTPSLLHRGEGKLEIYHILGIEGSITAETGNEKYYLVICNIAFYFVEMDASFGFSSSSN